MARFTALDSAAIAQLAERFGVGAVRDYRALDAGTINSNFVVDCEGARYFLRVNEDKALADVTYEAELVCALADRGVPTPRPLLAGGERFTEHEGKLVSLFPWVPGYHVRGDDPACARQLGHALGTLHDAADTIEGLPPHFGIYTTEQIAARLAKLDDSDPNLSTPLATLRNELGWLEARGTPATEGVIHGDLFPDNVLWNGGEEGVSGDLVALIDFEQASLGDRIYDLAVCINAWCYPAECGGGFDPGCAAAMIAGYRAVRGAVPADQLWRELRRSAWRFTITRITDVYLKGIDDPQKDFRRYFERLLLWRERSESAVAELVQSA